MAILKEIHLSGNNSDYPRLLETPISEISEATGTEGLRRRLAAEAIDAFGLGESFDVIDDAHLLAYEIHDGQRRTREQYENHLLRVAIRGISSRHLGVKNAEFIGGLLLHDCVEDQFLRLARLYCQPVELSNDLDEAELRLMAFEYLGSRFPQLSVAVIEGMTNPLSIPGTDSQDQYYEHTDELMDTGDPYAAVGKMSDNMDNGVGILWAGDASPEQYVKWATKYHRILPLLRKGLLRADLPLDNRARVFCTSQFDLAEQRYKAILGGQFPAGSN